MPIEQRAKPTPLGQGHPHDGPALSCGEVRRRAVSGVLAYHAHLCPEPDARSAATAALERAGFTVEPILHAPEGHGVLWGWRP